MRGSKHFKELVSCEAIVVSRVYILVFIQYNAYLFWLIWFSSGQSISEGDHRVTVGLVLIPGNEGTKVNHLRCWFLGMFISWEYCVFILLTDTEGSDCLIVGEDRKSVDYKSGTEEVTYISLTGIHRLKSIQSLEDASMALIMFLFSNRKDVLSHLIKL